MAEPPTERPGKPKNSSVQALIKAEKLTQIAFVLPVSVLVGWLLGGLADRLLHQHWIFIAGLIVGAVAGFVQLFRMIAQPDFLAGSAPDPNAAKGPGFGPSDKREDR